MCTVYTVLSSRPYQRISVGLSEVLELGLGEEQSDAILVTEKGWCLHEFNFSQNHAVFVYVGEICELFTAAFSYQRLMEFAKQVATIKFDAFLSLADSIQHSMHLVHLFNIGHCGSTLLHNVINANGEAWSLSEPKFTFDLAKNRDLISDDRRSALARAGIAYLSLLPRISERRIFVLKHFSQAMKIFATWFDATPNAINLFLYRDAHSWTNSFYGFAQRKGVSTQLPRNSRSDRWQRMSVSMPESFVRGILDFDADDLRFEDMAAVTWARNIHEFLEARSNGMVMHSFSYQQLTKDRAATVRAVFAACGISDHNLGQALEAFDHDSHQGQNTSHDIVVEKLPDEARARIDKVLSHPLLNVDAFIQL